MAQALKPRRPLTKRGAATRLRIVESAAKLVYEQGARGTSLDEVMELSGTSKSQLYHYFENKEALLGAVIRWQTSRVIGGQAELFRKLDSLAALRRWSAFVAQSVEAHQGKGGCPLGSLASELVDHSESARLLLAQSFQLWEGYLVTGLEAMSARGELRPSVDPRDLATATMAALQGGKLLAQTERSARPLRLALEMAIANIARNIRPKARVKTRASSS